MDEVTETRAMLQLEFRAAATVTVIWYSNWLAAEG